MSKKFKPDIKASKLNDKDIVQVLHMDDYFREEEGGPWANKPHTWKQFKKENTYEDEDFDLNLWYEASGDGQENYALLTIHEGQIKVVVP